MLDTNRVLPPTVRSLTVAALFGVLVAGALAPVGASATADLDPRDRSLSPSQRLEALLVKCRQAQSTLETLEAEFVQTKESMMLLEPSEAVGKFSYAAPDRVRWEYERPEPISLLITDQQMTTWYRDLDTAETAYIGKKSQRIFDFLGAGSDLERLMQYFSVSLVVPPAGTEPYRLELIPRFAQVAKRIQGMKIWIDPQLFLPVGLRYVEPDGDTTEYRFDRFRVNGELPGDRFELDIPSGVEINTVELPDRPAPH